MGIAFNEIKFGCASAEAESSEHPELLINGYFDQKGIIDRALNGRQFLFLGYKGSGKSAINKHIELVSRKESQLFVTSLFLQDFPFDDFKRINTGNNDCKFASAWSWIILLYICKSFQDDMGVLDNAGNDFFNAIKVLEQLGLLPNLPQLTSIVQVSSRKSFKLKIPQVADTTFENVGQNQGLQIPFFNEKLRTIISKISSKSRHYIILDGFDDAITGVKMQFEVLSSLILEASRLNAFFSENDVPAKIIIMCRTDIYEKFQDANKNKIRQDYAISLDWYHDPKEPGESDLIKLVNLRANLFDDKINNVFKSFFPKKINDVDTPSFLLNFTRHTPRDFVQLLIAIQKCYYKGKLDVGNVMSGIRKYSVDYFLPEIKDELSGFIEPKDLDNFINLISSSRKKIFKLDELKENASNQSRYSNLDIEAILSLLYECSAVGNVKDYTTHSHYTFKYRNRHSSLCFDENLCLHRALIKALNI